MGCSISKQQKQQNVGQQIESLKADTSVYQNIQRDRKNLKKIKKCNHQNTKQQYKSCPSQQLQRFQKFQSIYSGFLTPRTIQSTSAGLNFADSTITIDSSVNKEKNVTLQQQKDPNNLYDIEIKILDKKSKFMGRNEGLIKNINNCILYNNLEAYNSQQ